MSFKFALIKDSESEILKQIHDKNPDESSLWKIPNILVPLATIVLAMLAHLFFSATRFNFMAYVNIVLNGSLPLVAINQISAIGLHVFKFEKGKEIKYGIKIEYLRTRLFYACLVLLVFGVLFFAFQVINSPLSSFLVAAISFSFSVLFLFVSSRIAKNIFLLQENLIDNTFEKDILNEAEKKHGQDW
jgi:hypothetical protein